jgi:hypothetical protein
MDYSKDPARGGTRIHDPVKVRSLGTGVGQTVHANRRTGTDRMIDVHNRIPHDKRDSISDPAHADLQSQMSPPIDPKGMNLPGTPMQYPAVGSGPDAKSVGTRDKGKGGEHVSPSSNPPGPRRMAKLPGAVQG